MNANVFAKMDSDLEERELERLVFGNDTEFQNGITEFNHSTRTKLHHTDDSDEYEIQNETGLEGLDDGDVPIQV